MNPDLVIYSLDSGAKLEIEFYVGSGKGYVSASNNRPYDAPIGLIPVDSIFSPVRQVSLTKLTILVLVKTLIMIN